MQITKNMLRNVQAEIGKLDTDTDQVFEGFVGRLELSDNLYHGELTYSDPGDFPPAAKVSIATVLGLAEPITTTESVIEPEHIETTIDGDTSDGDT